MARFTGKVVIVTGSSRGIGKATALEFAREGATVVVAARTEVERSRIPGTIHQTVSEIRELGGQAVAVRTDVSDEESVDNLVGRTISELGRIDVLVNNAAGAFYKPVIDSPAARWDVVVGANLRGTFLCSRAVLPQMLEQGGGNILNLSSIAAEHPMPSFTGAAYCATKAAIERFSTVLAGEMRDKNIAVNCVKPRGAVVTEGMILQNLDRDYSSWDKIGDFIVKAILFLASQDTSGVTGRVCIDKEICDEFGLA